MVKSKVDQETCPFVATVLQGKLNENVMSAQSCHFFFFHDWLVIILPLCLFFSCVFFFLQSVHYLTGWKLRKGLIFPTGNKGHTPPTQPRSNWQAKITLEVWLLIKSLNYVPRLFGSLKTGDVPDKRPQRFWSRDGKLCCYAVCL